MQILRTIKADLLRAIYKDRKYVTRQCDRKFRTMIQIIGTAKQRLQNT